MKRVQVPVNGDADHQAMQAAMQVLMDMGLEHVMMASIQEASRPGLMREGPAFILTVPDEWSERSARRMVDHALSDVKVHPRLYAGQRIAVE